MMNFHSFTRFTIIMHTYVVYMRISCRNKSHLGRARPVAHNAHLRNSFQQNISFSKAMTSTMDLEIFSKRARDSIPGRDRPMSLKQIVRAPMTNARQQVRVLRVLGDDHYNKVSQYMWHAKEPSRFYDHECRA